MIVSFAGKSYVREMRKIFLFKNGTMLDISFDDDGNRRIISIPIRAVQAFLVSSNTEINSYGEWDEPINIATALKDFNNRNTVKRGI